MVSAVLIDEDGVIVLDDDNTIHFGEVSCGAKQCRPIHLINRGRAQVPIRIILSAVSF